MSRPKTLLQLDTDRHASVFDAMVAVDSGVEHLLQYGGVTPADVRGLVHGAIFTRSPRHLKHTAVFVGGSDVAAAEAVLREVASSFFGPLRVSVLFDANGANTTAAAAVVVASRHVELAAVSATVLAATGPVGQRAVRLLAGAGAQVRVASRRYERAESVCRELRHSFPDARLIPHATSTPDETMAAVAGVEVVIAAGAAGVELLAEPLWSQQEHLRVAIDLNAVPPTGLAGIDPKDTACSRHGVTCYGAIGVGQLKMRIHQTAVRALFEANDRVLDADEVFRLATELAAATDPETS
jgi:methylenetetrahydrofolate/methylenetetrahydromethanopterin dehydrogenase (NADP+)